MRFVVLGFWFLLTSATLSLAQTDAAGEALARAMEAVSQGNWEQAKAEAEPAGDIALDIVEWHRLRRGNGTFAQYRAFLEKRADWPGLPLLREKGEPSIPESADPAQVMAYFKEQKPRTGIGALRLANAFRAQGNARQARAIIVKSWRTMLLSPEEEQAILATYSKVLVNHHRARQDMLLWRAQTKAASRLNPLVGSAYRKLAEARIALIDGRRTGLAKLIAAVPPKLADDPGLAFARFQWRLANGRWEDAIAMLRERSRSRQALGQPEAWADRRRSMARDLMRKGDMRAAYELASRHYLKEGDDFKDLEWLAGYIALTGLNDPKTALRHFRRFRAGVDSPISLGRAAYWEGRAYETLGDAESARAAFAFGAQYQTSFYGQLAAQKAGLPMAPELAGREYYADFMKSPHARSSVFQAALLFRKAGYPLLFTRFVRHLAESLTPQQQGAMAQAALDMDETYTALYLAKYAAKSGTVLMRPYFPAPKILPANLPVPKELAYAIIRRESEFYPRSTSRAGARGLMQLMPGTARDMAKKLGVPFKPARLLSDPAYNARLGSAYLAKLMEENGGYYPFVAAAYNAGPRRPPQWVAQFGDPRKSPETAVDWIEHIPFRETRNYVMRVMESLAVYRARLARKPVPLRLEKDLTGQP